MSRLIRFLTPLAFFILLVVLLWQGLHRRKNDIPSPLIGKPVPTFTASLLMKSDKMVTNKIFFGHISLLNVWASWCYSCKAEHPVLMTAALSNKVILLGLDYKDNRKEAILWLKTRGNPFQKIIDDPKGKLGIDLGVYGTPETFLIDSEGIIRYKYVGPISPYVWRDKILPEIEKLRK